jgi:uncharacterized protein YbaR (Trm112 family)
MSFDLRLLDIVCCPATHLPLKPMPESMLARLNARIGAGRLRHRDDSPVTEPLDQALVTADDRLAYAIRDDIPILLEELAIPLVEAEEPQRA